MPFLGRLCKLSDIFFFLGGGNPVRGIFGVIQFLYLNTNMSLIIAEMRKETNPEEQFFGDMKFRLLNFLGVES